MEYTSIGLLLLRIFIGLRLIYGVIDYVLSWEKMIKFADFLAAFHFPMPTVSAVVSFAVQLLGGLSLLLGLYTKLFSSLLVINFIIALVVVHLQSNDSAEVMTPALAMLFGSLTIWFTGPGKYSVKHFLNKN